jgi:carbon storage regulator
VGQVAHCAPAARLLYFGCQQGFFAVQAREATDVLVLTRKANQSIMIGDEIEVSVLAIMGEKVRIGIAAPRSVPVFRKEVYLEIQEDRRQAGEAGGVDRELDGAV